MGGVRENTRSGTEGGEIQVEVLAKRMTDTKDGRGLREDKEWHRGRGDTGGSVGERNN